MRPLSLGTYRARLFELADRLFPKDDPAHDAAHQKRVAGLVERMQAKEGGDPYVGLAVAIFHDTPTSFASNGTKFMSSLQQALKIAKLLETVDPARAAKDSDFIQKVAYGVDAQKDSPSRIATDYPSVVLEALQVKAAEDIEGSGAIGWARAFTIGAIGGRPFIHPQHPNDPFCMVRPLDKDSSTLDFIIHVNRKISVRLKDYTPAGQDLLRQRTDFTLNSLTDFERYLNTGQQHRDFLEKLPPRQAKFREKLLSMADQYYGGKDPAHDSQHIRRVIANAERIWLKEGRPAEAPIEALWIAGFAHDLVQYDKHSPMEAKAAPHSARRATSMLLRDIPDIYHSPGKETVHLGLEAAAVHSWSQGDKGKISLVARILQDADRLDNVGAVGLARTFNMGAILKHKRPLHAEFDAFCEEREPSRSAGTADMIPSRLVQVPHRLNTDYARHAAVKGVEFVEKFWEQLKVEVRQSRPDMYPVVNTRAASRGTVQKASDIKNPAPAVRIQPRRR